jgi:hypothetical protein
VTLTTTDEAPSSERFRAHLDNVERETANGHIPVAIDVPDGVGPTRKEAIRALEKSIMAWLREHTS